MYENTPISTVNMERGLRRAQKKPASVPWYRVLKSVRTRVHANPARWRPVIDVARHATRFPVAAASRKAVVIDGTVETWDSSYYRDAIEPTSFRQRVRSPPLSPVLCPGPAFWNGSRAAWSEVNTRDR